MTQANSMPANASADPTNATVVLRGVAVEVDSDVGQTFTADCVRFVEGIVTEEQLRKKYSIDDDGWRLLASHDALQQAVGTVKERRIRSGQAAQEKAAHLFVSCPDVLGGIVNDAGAVSNRSDQGAEAGRGSRAKHQRASG